MSLPLVFDAPNGAAPPRHLADLDRRADWGHRSIAGPDLEIADVIDGGALVGVRLGVNLEDVSELVELRRVDRTSKYCRPARQNTNTV